MKLNFDRNFTDCFGREIHNESTGKASNIGESLCMVIFNLNTLGGQPMPPEKKYKAHRICRKIAATPGEVEITTEEATLLKEIASEAYSTGAYGQVVDIIEGNE